jgi:hypothetical protein
MSFYTLVVYSIFVIAMGIYGGMSTGAIIGLLVIPFFYWWRTSVQNSANKDIGKPIPKDSKKIVKEEVPIMWDFKLKKTRVILIATIIYSVLFYWFGIEEDVLDELWYWSWMSPVFIYWIVIPSYRWIMKGK